MERKEFDIWRLPTLCLWMVFLAAGLFPDATFEHLRMLGRVVPQHALVNSPFILTLLLSGFLGVFGWYQCGQVGRPQPEAQDKGLHLTIIGLVAFLPIDFASLLSVHANPLIQHQLLIYAGGFAKLACWIYVLLIVLRYYLIGDEEAFSRAGSAWNESSNEPHDKPHPDSNSTL